MDSTTTNNRPQPNSPAIDWSPLKGVESAMREATDAAKSMPGALGREARDTIHAAALHAGGLLILAAILAAFVIRLARR